MSGKTWCVALVCSAFLALPSAAQEGSGKDEIPAQPPPETEQSEAKEAPPAEDTAQKSKDLEIPQLHRWGGLSVSLAGWSPSATGDKSQLALVYPGNAAPYPLTLPDETRIRESWIVAYYLPKDLGAIVLHYDSMNISPQENFFSPGQFIYFETLATPGYSGAFDNGLADAVSANSLVKTRDFRLEFQNTAWDTKHTHATWAAGARSLDNNELLQVTYYALVPNLPPAIPPIIDPPVNPYSLAPVPDTVTEQSDFSGRGAGASLDVEFKLAPRISIVSGLSIGLLRGKTTTYFQSNTSYYYQSFGTPHYLSKEELFAILDSGDPSEIRGITQVPVVNALSVPSTSQAAQTYEIYVGLQSRIWRGLQVFATYRELYYQNVGARAVLTADGTVDTTPVSIGYDGYLLGLSWRF